MNHSSLYFAILEMNKRCYSTYSLYYRVSQKSDFQNATEAQILTKIECCGANFTMDLGALDPT